MIHHCHEIKTNDTAIGNLLGFFQFVPDGSQISAKGIFLEIRLFVAGMHAGNRADTAAFRHISRQRGKGYPHPHSALHNRTFCG